MLRPLLLLLALAAHLSTAAAAPRIVEICTSHGSFPMLEEAAPGEGCEVCLALCDLAAAAPDLAGVAAPPPTGDAHGAAAPGIAALALPRANARAPPAVQGRP